MNTEQEPQAQAEPEVVARISVVINGNPAVVVGRPPKEPGVYELITLQSHREAMAGWDVTKRRLESQASHAEQDAQKLRAHCIAYRESIANKDAALDACLEALEYYQQQRKYLDVCGPAITQAKEARK